MINKSLKEEKGITLVALIITIIVLLILAIVSIRLVMNGGIIDRAERGTKEYTESEMQEQIKLAYSEWQTAQWTSDAGDAATFIQTRLRTALNDNGLTVTGENGTFTLELSNGKQYSFNVATGQIGKVKTVAEYPEIAPNIQATENSKYISNGKIAVIPAGYTVSSTASEQSIDNGLVIKRYGNEWVWIPVSNEDFTAMFGTASDDGWTMNGTDVKTKYKTNSGVLNQTRVNPGDSSAFREPDVLNSSSNDDNTTNLSAAGLGANITEMATNLRNDYKNMMNSVKRYGGFYIGRYELSSSGTKKNKASLSNINWYNSYAACKASTLGASSVETRMIWGCQWDLVCKFISTSGDRKSLLNSKSYGNYKDSTSPANKGNYQKDTKKPTGSNEAWKANNIYDLAGNCSEWTQEAYNWGYRVHRGGTYSASNKQVTYRDYLYAYFTPNGSICSRPVLYVK